MNSSASGQEGTEPPTKTVVDKQLEHPHDGGEEQGQNQEGEKVGSKVILEAF